MKKIALINIVLGIFSLSSCFQNPTTKELEEQNNFEQSCKFDSIGKMTLSEQKMSDSMIQNKFKYFKIDHEFHFWRCNGRNELSEEKFYLRYKRMKPVLKSMESESLIFLSDITKHVFSHYISDNDIMRYDRFYIEDGFFGKQKEFKREEIFKLCGFKIVSTGKNKWKRITI